MKNLGFAILLGGLIAVPFHASTAQTTNIAYASQPQPGYYMVFFNKGPAQLSSAAAETVHHAAANADKSGGMIRVVGRADYAQAVKSELMRDGVPARSIVVVPKVDNPLPTIADGVSEPANRRVEIKY